MKYIKRFNRIKNENSNIKLYEGLSNEEIKSYNYILGLNESYDNPINESKLVDRLKNVAKKGLLTATLFASLMSNSTFASEYNSLSNNDKKEIKMLVSDDKQDDKQVNYQDVNNPSDSVSVNIGNEFKSAEYKIDQSKYGDIFGKLEPINDFIKNHDGSNMTITIESSESKVPNRDIDTKERLPEGELANRRFETAKKIVEDFFSKNDISNVKIQKDVKIGGPKYQGDDVNQDKYKDHQYLKITISVDYICKTCEETTQLCGFEYDTKGKLGVEANSYIGKEFSFDVENVDTDGEFILEPGSIPDRAVMYIDGVKSGDTGYFSDKDHQYSDFRYVPEYVLSLTKMRIKNPNIEATQNMEVVNVKSVDELKKLMQENQEYDVFKDKKNLSEVNNPYKQLIKMVQNSGNKGLDVVIYKTTKQTIKYHTDGKAKKIEFKVYSPVQKTEFSAHTNCNG